MYRLLQTCIQVGMRKQDLETNTMGCMTTCKLGGLCLDQLEIVILLPADITTALPVLLTWTCTRTMS